MRSIAALGLTLFAASLAACKPQPDKAASNPAPSERPEDQGIVPEGWLLLGARFDTAIVREAQGESKLALSELPYQACNLLQQEGIDRFYWTFRTSAPGSGVPEAESTLDIYVETSAVPEAESEWRFDAATKTQYVSLQLSAAGTVSGVWATLAPAALSPACVLRVTRSERLSALPAASGGLGEFGVMARLTCERLPDVAAAHGGYLTIDARVGCRGIMIAPAPYPQGPVRFEDTDAKLSWLFTGFSTHAAATAACAAKGLRLPTFEQARMYAARISASKIGGIIRSAPQLDVDRFWIDSAAPADAKTSFPLDGDSEESAFMLSARAKQAGLCVGNL